jgi:hypothetical protein
MKKLFLGLILFGFILAGIALGTGCICYINPDDTVSWCTPEGCNLEKEGYCGVDGSYCKFSIPCCEGYNCVKNKCVFSCIAESGTCTVSTDCCSGGCSNKHCCPTGQYWSTAISDCSKPDYCNVCSGTAIFHIPSCAYNIGTREICCSMDLVGGKTAGAWATYIIYN